MKYKSTRGGVDGISFKDAFLMGLATDGGLILPTYIPKANLDKLRNLTYKELAFEIFKLFIDDIDEKNIKRLIDKSYATFDTDEITPVVKKSGVYVLELFHGPTFAFKDIALQFLGNLFEYVLEKTDSDMNILGATSGDTGSAAIYGLKGKRNVNIFILHPHNKVSFVQELQMTTVEDKNVYNIAIEGTFDDCQAIVKAIFNDLEFKERYNLGAVNSINWARILAQIVYYFYAYFKSGVDEPIFSVPTGNFGDIFAGYIAKKMGLPIKRLILATNSNDILYRFVNFGDYSISNVVQTMSPSMDIQVSSNLERYLYYLFDEEPLRVKEAMETFSKQKKLVFGKELSYRIRQDFESYAATEQNTIETIKSMYEKTGYVIDPHTATGVFAAFESGYENVICLSTAHPAKFPDAIEKAIGKKPDEPVSLEILRHKEKRLTILENSIEAVKEFIEKSLKNG